jgi:uncharacterized membrane protein
MLGAAGPLPTHIGPGTAEAADKRRNDLQEPTYNRIAGGSIERLAALSDGVFAIAMTLLVLDLRVPAREAIHSEADLWRALAGMAPHLATYLMSFLTLGIFWVGQQTQLNFMARSDRDLAWLHIAFLLFISLIWFSTAFLAQFIGYRLALFVYWLNILLPGIFLFVSWRYAQRAGLLRSGAGPDFIKAVERRIVVAQTLYALGMLLCFVNTYVSIAAIVLVQLNYVFAPRIRPLYRI